MSAADSPVLEVEGLAKRYGRVHALRSVDFRATAGECVAVLGPNGAGKSTLLRIIAGLVRPNSGRVLLRGNPLRAQASDLRRRLGYLAHETMLYDSLSTWENLRFAGALHAVPNLRSRIDQLVRSLDLAARVHDPVRTLSRGMKQRVALARALVNDPQVLLLDEPYTGLDCRAGDVLSTLLRAVRQRDRLILLVTHDLRRGLEVAGRALVIAGGKVAMDRQLDGVGADDFEDQYASCLETSVPLRDGAGAAIRSGASA